MRIGIICPSEIAIRRFMPALKKCSDLSFSGIGVFSKEERFADTEIDDDTFLSLLDIEKQKAESVVEMYGGKVFGSYNEIVSSQDVDAIYIPLPPALHYYWAKKALENGKHVLVEKPSTLCVDDSKELVRIASEKNLALHENYMFVFHSQLGAIEDMVKGGEIGEVRLHRINFGFPMRAKGDFRYCKALGGGALIDAGGYTICYAKKILGPSARICCAQSNYISDYEVDMYGSATLTNTEGKVVQVAFGMDNSYKCEIEIWGSQGTLYTDRVLTAPVGFSPTVTIKKGTDKKTIELPGDDTFYKSINYFVSCINNEEIRISRYKEIIEQAQMVDDFKRLANWK